MSDWKEKNAANWVGEEWKKEVLAIKNHRDFSPAERDHAFLSLRKRVYGLYYRTFASYAKLFMIEGEEIYSLLDYLLYRCALKFTLERSSFFKYFQESIKFVVKHALRHETMLVRTGYKRAQLNPFTPDPKEVVHSVADEVRQLLSPIQRKVLDLRMAGYTAEEITEKTALNDYEIKRTVAQIRDTAREILEV
jgi:hypothetical protein